MIHILSHTKNALSKVVKKFICAQIQSWMDKGLSFVSNHVAMMATYIFFLNFQKAGAAIIRKKYMYMDNIKARSPASQLQ